MVVEEVAVEERALRPVGCCKKKGEQGRRKRFSIHLIKAGTLGGLVAGGQRRLTGRSGGMVVSRGRTSGVVVSGGRNAFWLRASERPCQPEVVVELG